MCNAKNYTDAEIYSTTSFTNPPASQFWCGNRWRLPGRDLNPNPDAWSDDPKDGDASDCHSLGRRFDGSFMPAQMKAEIRGWIRRNPEGDPADPWIDAGYEYEYKTSIEPDIGWRPSTQDVWPLNTFERVAQWMRPLNSDGFLHVEYNFWAPLRVCGFHQTDARGCIGTTFNGFWNNGCGSGQVGTSPLLPPNPNRFCPSWHYGTNRPREWCFNHSESIAPLPFDLDNPPHESGTDAGRFKAGDYVRIVGTLWEDFPHQNTECISGAQADCKGITNPRANSTVRRGWIEIHPVDFMARIKAPANRPGLASTDSVSNTGIAYLNACVSDVAGEKTSRQVFVAPPPRPGNNYKLHVREIIDPDFTNLTSVAPTKATFDQRVQIVDGGTRAMASVEVSSIAGARRGLFRAAYLASWEPCTPSCRNKCNGASDGCSGVCTGACPAGYTCSSGTCCAPNTRWCNGACRANCACPKCSCGGTSCEGTPACEHVCRSQGKGGRNDGR